LPQIQVVQLLGVTEKDDYFCIVMRKYEGDLNQRLQAPPQHAFPLTPQHIFPSGLLLASD